MDAFGPKYDILWLTSSHVMDAFGPMTYFVPYHVWMHLGLSPSSFVPLHSQNSETGFIWAFTPYLAYFVPCDAFMDAFQPSESYEIALIFSHKTIFCPCRKMVTSDHKRGPQLSSGGGCVRALLRPTFIWMHLGTAHTLDQKNIGLLRPGSFRGERIHLGQQAYFVPYLWIHLGQTPPPRGGGEG